MKYIITESQIETYNNYLNTVFDSVFDIDNIMYGNSEEDEDFWDFYTQDKGGRNLIFTWVDGETPIVKIYGRIASEFDEKLGEAWKRAFKEWFQEAFGKQVIRIKY
jgi:hypothetical protein